MKLTEKQKIILVHISTEHSVHEKLVNKHTATALYDRGLLESWMSIDGNFWELTTEGVAVVKKLKTKKDEN